MLADISTAGNGFTITVTSADASPHALDAVTVYVVVAAGERVSVGPVYAPGFHVNGLVTFVAFAVNVTDWPWHMDDLVANTFIVGGSAKNAVIVPLAVHP
jgi:hypothetical protein